MNFLIYSLIFQLYYPDWRIRIYHNITENEFEARTYFLSSTVYFWQQYRCSSTICKWFNHF